MFRSMKRAALGLMLATVLVLAGGEARAQVAVDNLGAESIHAGEHGDANVMSKYRRDRAAQQQHENEDYDSRRPDP